MLSTKYAWDVAKLLMGITNAAHANGIYAQKNAKW
jgi:hypothetical protein